MHEVVLDLAVLLAAGGAGGVLYGLVYHERYLLRMPFGDGQLSLGVIGDVLAGCCGSVGIFVLAGDLLNLSWVDVPYTTSETLKVLALGIVAGFGGLTLMHGLSSAVISRVAGDVEDLRRGSKAQGLALEGSRYLLERQHMLALEAFDKSLEMDPDAIDVLLNKAKVLKRLDQPSEALMVVERALELDPTNHRALYNRACYYSIVNPADKAKVVEYLERAIRVRGMYRTIAQHDEDFIEIRDDPEFVAVTGARGAGGA